MKRFSFFLSALAVALFSSCNKEEAPVANDAIFGTVPVTVEQPIDPSTKVVINESGDTFTLSLTDTDYFGLIQCAELENRANYYKKWVYSNGVMEGEIPSNFAGSYLIMLSYADSENSSYKSGLGGGVTTIRGSISGNQKASSVKGLLIAKTEECAAGEMPSVFNFKTMNSFLKFSVKKSEEASNATLETITIASASQIAGQFGFQVGNIDLETGFNDEDIRAANKLNSITLDCEHAALSTDANVFYASLAYGQLEGLTVTFTFSDESTIVKTIGKNSGVTLERNTVYALPVITYTGTGSSNPGQEEETATADFIFHTDEGLAALGITKPSSSQGTNLGSSTYTSGSISMTSTNGGTATRVWNSAGTTTLRVYKDGGSLTFSGATIKKIVFTGTVPLTANVGTFSEKTWTGSATSVTFTATNSVTINTIEVSYIENDPASTPYRVNCDTVDGGTLSADPESATKGTEITLTATPNDEYEFNNDWAVKDASDNAITVTNGKFTMPASAVTVSGSFRKKTYAITATVATNGAYAVKVGGNVVTSASKGDKVILEDTPDAGYLCDGWTVTETESGNKVYVSNNYFTMPAAAVTITTSFSEIPVVTYEGSGTEDDPYTVDDAIKLINTLGTASSDLVCVEGTISKVDSYNTTYKSIQYWLNDNKLEVYSGKNLNNTDFASKDDLAVGDKVVVKGNLKKFNDTYEFDKNNYIVSIKKAPYLKATASKSSGIAAAGETITINVDTNVESWTASSNSEAFVIKNVTDKSFDVEVSANSNTENGRTATITISADGVDDFTIDFSQDKFIDPSTPASPFEWNGGGQNSLTEMKGVTASGLGSDYANANAPYQVKLDGTGDYIIIEVGFEIQSVQLKVKMIGGATASSIKIQESDAKTGTFTDVQTMTISGSQNSVVDFTTSSAFKSGSRAVKLYFTKGSNVGLGYIKITPKN